MNSVTKIWLNWTVSIVVFTRLQFLLCAIVDCFIPESIRIIHRMSDIFLEPIKYGVLPTRTARLFFITLGVDVDSVIECTRKLPEALLRCNNNSVAVTRTHRPFLWFYCIIKTWREHFETQCLNAKQVRVYNNFLHHVRIRNALSRSFYLARF